MSAELVADHRPVRRPVRRPARGGARLPSWLGSVAALAWLLVPLAPLLVWTVAERWSAPGALPQEWGLRGFRDALDAGLLPALGRSVVLGLAVALLATPLGAMAGRALGWRETRRPGAVAAALLLPVLLPPFAVSMGLDVILLRLGVPGPVAVVGVLVVFALPYCAYVTATGYAALDPELEEQARSLGATARQARYRATLPAVRRSLTVAAVLAFLVGWSDYVVTVLLGGGRFVTLPLLLGSAASGSGNEPGVAALAVSTALPPLLLIAVVGLSTRAARRRSAGARNASDRPATQPVDSPGVPV